MKTDLGGAGEAQESGGIDLDLPPVSLTPPYPPPASFLWEPKAEVEGPTHFPWLGRPSSFGMS